MSIKLSPYALLGPRLVEMGYSAVPITPGTKQPGTLRGAVMGWRTRFNKKLPSEFEVTSWANEPDAGVGLVCGFNGVVAIDIDTVVARIFAAIVAILPETPVRKVGHKGETLFFRAGPGVPSKSFDIPGPDGKLTRAVDIIADGRQTLLPPTIHPDTGKPYQWVGERALDEIEPADLPELPGDIAERIAAVLAPFGHVVPVARPPRLAVDNGDQTPFRTVNDLAMRDFGCWVPRLCLYRLRATHAGGYEAVPTWRSSRTGRPLEKRKLNLKIHSGGIRDFGMGESDPDAALTPLDLVMRACDCDFDVAFKNLAHWTGWATEEPIEVAKPVLVEVPAPVEQHDVEPTPVAAVPAEPRSEAASSEDDLTNVPGVLGDIVDWITATARRPSRPLALGAALCVLGTLIGRRAATPTNSGTHLYVLGLAPTGAGKQHPISCIERLMMAAGAGHHVGPSQFMSMSAVISMLNTMPLAVCPQDEFGALLKKLGSNKASPHEQGVSMILRGLWGASFDVYRTPVWAGRPSERFMAPALSLYGLSNPNEFYDALTGADVTNGFLNRFLVLAQRDWPTDQDPELDPRTVPTRLSEALATLYRWGSDSIADTRLINPTHDFAPQTLPWHGAEAKGVYEDFSRHVEGRMRADQGEAPFLARTAEMAVRMATIRAAGRWGHVAAVGADDMEWGANLSMRSSLELIQDAQRNMVEELGIGQLTVRVLRLVEMKGSITHRELHRKMQQSFRRSADLVDVMKTLETADRITIEKNVPLSGGPPTVTYRFKVA